VMDIASAFTGRRFSRGHASQTGGREPSPGFSPVGNRSRNRPPDAANSSQSGQAASPGNGGTRPSGPSTAAATPSAPTRDRNSRADSPPAPRSGGSGGGNQPPRKPPTGGGGSHPTGGYDDSNNNGLPAGNGGNSGNSGSPLNQPGRADLPPAPQAGSPGNGNQPPWETPTGGGSSLRDAKDALQLIEEGIDKVTLEARLRDSGWFEVNAAKTGGATNTIWTNPTLTQSIRIRPSGSAFSVRGYDGPSGGVVNELKQQQQELGKPEWTTPAGGHIQEFPLDSQGNRGPGGNRRRTYRNASPETHFDLQ
jgi:hypothetical protein